jgi:hypothetical protein
MRDKVLWEPEKFPYLADALLTIFLKKANNPKSIFFGYYFQKID